MSYVGEEITTVKVSQIFTVYVVTALSTNNGGEMNIHIA